MHTLWMALLLLAADLTGNWSFQVETSSGSGSPTFTFQQQGEALTGTYEGLLGSAKVAGTVKGDKVEFSFNGNAGGETIKVVYTGAVEGDRKMKGVVKLGDLGEGTWTATKK